MRASWLKPIGKKELSKKKKADLIFRLRGPMPFISHKVGVLSSDLKLCSAKHQAGSALLPILPGGYLAAAMSLPPTVAVVA